MKRVLFAPILAVCLLGLAWAQDPGAEPPGGEPPVVTDPNAVDPNGTDPNAPDPGIEDPNAPDPGVEDPNEPDPGIEDPNTEEPLPEGPVYFPDARLKEVIERELWIWDPTPADMLELTCLRASSWGIGDLTGLEHATNLYELEVPFNEIGDLSPLAGLTELTRLVVNNNRISDISPLSDLTGLTHLDVHDNSISDISVVSGFTGLETLVVRLNPISDLSPLSGLTELRDLDVHMASVSDISPLSDLTTLERLILQFNQISDISPLAGLTELRELNLRYNSISDVSPLTGLPNLTDLNLSSNRLSDISPLAEMTGLDTLVLEGNLNLNQEAYCYYLHRIVSNGTSLRYSLGSGVPAGVTAQFRSGGSEVEVSWDEVCHGPLYEVYYRVYRSIPPAQDRDPVSEWQTAMSFTDTALEPGIEYAYWVRTATSAQGDNRSDYSSPATVSSSQSQPILTVASLAGGSVISPGEGRFPINGRTVVVTAKPIDVTLYFFAGWTGSAVDAGRVISPAQSSTVVTVDRDYTLTAHFATHMDVLYVDDDAPDDPGPRVTITSDPREDGTVAHPFDRIQEALEVAGHGATIVVRPGVYRENLDLLGKNVHLTGLDPNAATFPVIEGSDGGPVVSFTHGEDPNCLLTGFVITAGNAQQAGAIACLRSSPTVANCLIVGNRAGGSEGAAIYCQDSEAWFGNCTIVDNIGGAQGAALVLNDSHITLYNSIVWDNAPRQIVLRGESGAAITYCDIADGWLDAGNLEANPRFASSGYWADPDNIKRSVDPSQPDAIWVGGDYHLKSRAGRWDPLTHAWVQDSATSPCIDAGDPATPVGNEPQPHGDIINMGAYGGTTQASMGK